MKYLASYLEMIQNSAIGPNAALELAQESELGFTAFARANVDDLMIVIYADRGPVVTGVAPIGTPDFELALSVYLQVIGTDDRAALTEGTYDPAREPEAFPWVLQHFDAIAELLKDPLEFQRLMVRQTEWLHRSR